MKRRFLRDNFIMSLLHVLGVILCSLTLGNAEVFTNAFQNCREFFYKDTEPSGIVPKNSARICQFYEKQYRFATMYDRDLLIPLYSAYIYERGVAERAEWMIEPQLVDTSYSRAMEEEHLAKIDRKKLNASQAVDADYAGAVYYDRGHLNPTSHHVAGPASKSTCTLTNIVPQDSTLNQGPWAQYEDATMKKNTTGCQKTYAIVGVIPGKKTISSGRVNVPSKMWAAACCITTTRGVKSWAVIANNTKTGIVKSITVKELQEEIGNYTKRGVHLFHEECPEYCEPEDENSLWPVDASHIPSEL
ncbi:endonuclease domain-containing 1 protein-like [Pleurodeles waltl]